MTGSPEFEQPPSVPAARNDRAVPLFFGIFGGWLLAWGLAELVVRDIAYAELLHVTIALLGALLGSLAALVYVYARTAANRRR